MEDKDYKELHHLRKIYGLDDVATRAYKAVVKVLGQQVDFLENFNIKDKITAASKEDPVYERGIKIYENMPDNVIKLNELKFKLGIEYIEKEIIDRPISAKAIANGDV